MGKECFTLAAGGRVLAARTQVHVRQELPWCLAQACSICTVIAPLALAFAALDSEQAYAFYSTFLAIGTVLISSGCLGTLKLSKHGACAGARCRWRWPGR